MLFLIFSGLTESAGALDQSPMTAQKIIPAVLGGRFDNGFLLRFVWFDQFKEY